MKRMRGARLADRAATDEAEVELLRRAARGDDAALAELYDAYAGVLYGFGVRRLGHGQLAEELVQSVMTRLWRRAGTYDPRRGSVRTWVFVIARSVAVDLHRRRARDVAVGSLGPDRVDAGRVDAGRVDAWATSDDLDALLRAEAVRAALDRLGRDHREVLELAYFRSLTQQEIAGRLGVPLGTVKSRTYYALRALRLACEELGVQP